MEAMTGSAEWLRDAWTVTSANARRGIETKRLLFE